MQTTTREQNAGAGRSRNSRGRCLAATLIAALWAAGAGAGLVASNAGVPATMNAGGTAGNPALYLYEGAYVGTLSSMTVGSTTTYNEFDITEGSACTVSGTANIGNTGSAGRNAVYVTGAGSKLTIAALYIGNQSFDNALSVDEGATLVGTGYHYLGIAAGGGRNALTVSGGVYTGANTRVLMTGASSNSLALADGVKAYLRGIYVGTDSSFGNAALITGAGTRVMANQSIFIGSDLPLGSRSNTLTLANGALAQVDYGTTPGGAPHAAYCLKTGTATNNFLRLAGGYAASKQRPDYVLASRIQVWDGQAWVAGIASGLGQNYTKTTYVSEAAALAATGYSGLNGYTVFAGGQPWNPPPPPPNPATLIVIR